MTKAEAHSILSMLRRFAKIENQATDEIGWVAMHFSCPRTDAAEKIKMAREIVAKTAAMELLTALEALRQRAGGYIAGHTNEDDELLDTVDAAICKARGETGGA